MEWIGELCEKHHVFIVYINLRLAADPPPKGIGYGVPLGKNLSAKRRGFIFQMEMCTEMARES